MSIIIVLLQVFDIIIHAATNQLELLRVTSNLIIVAWLVMRTRITPRREWRVVGTYLALNLFFLAREGFTNPATGAPRTALFILVALTTVLSSLLLYRSTRAATSP